VSGQAISGAIGLAAPAGCITGAAAFLAIEQDKPALASWVALAPNHTRLDAAAQQA
jgi:hypothetical protein